MYSLPSIILNSEEVSAANIQSISLSVLTPKVDLSKIHQQNDLKIKSLRFYATILLLFSIGLCK